MWSRRVLRAGWLIAPVFAFPKAAFRFLFCNSRGEFSVGGFMYVSFMTAVFGFIAFMVHDVATEGNAVSAADIAEARGSSACMAEYVPQIAKNSGDEPLTYRDLEFAYRGCDKAARDHRAKLEQAQALGGTP